MNAGDERALRQLDEALVRLRRLWTASRAHVLDDLGQRVEMSSVLVVEACARAEGHDTTATIGHVATFLDVEASTASRLVQRAQTAQLISRGAAPPDGRRAALELTDAGRVLHSRATSARLSWLRDVVADWPAENLESLATSLAAFADALTSTRLEP